MRPWIGFALGATVVLGVACAAIASRTRNGHAMAAIELRFAQPLEPSAVIGFLVGLTGLLPPWWLRWLSTPTVTLEIEASSRGISYRILASTRHVNIVKHQLQASSALIRYDEIEVAAVTVDRAIEYRLNTNARPLRVDPAGTSTRLLTSLQPLNANESLVIQWLLTPAGPVRAERRRRGAVSTRTRTPRTSPEQASARRAKLAHPLLQGCARIGVRAGTSARQVQLLRQAEVAWHGARTRGVHFRRRWIPSSAVAMRLECRTSPWFDWPALVNVEELAGLLGWPIGERVPGLALGSSRVLAPTLEVPDSGTVLADSNYSGLIRPIALELDARLRHVHVLGPTGAGKSTLLLNMITADLHAGHGLVVVDAKGDLVADVLARVPLNRRADVVVLDPADTERPVGLNPLVSAGKARNEVLVENLVGLFRSLYRQSWGPRTDDILRASLQTLTHASEGTLCELPLLLVDPGYRARVLKKVDDPIGLESFWAWFASLSDAERVSVTAPVLNKVRAFTMRPTIRTIVGQAAPRLDFTEVFSEARVLLVSLAAGLLGTEAAALLGALVVAQLWNTATARAALPANRRRPVMAYIDEWQQFMHLPTPMAEVLAQARGLGLGLVLAHQNLDQVPTETRAAVLANARSRVVFQLPAADARIVARDMAGVLSAEELTQLGRHEVVITPFAAGTTQPPATGTTRPAPPTTSDAAELRAVARQHFGVDRTEVEAAIRARQLSAAGPTPIRRLRTTRPEGDG